MFLYVLDGLVAVVIDGDEHRLASGDCVNIPAGTAYATRVLSGAALWLASSAGGNGAALWDEAGTDTANFCFALETDLTADHPRLAELSGVDAALA